MDRAGELLQQLGLSRNEARAYTALLACQPASAYEIAKQSGVPTSKIYETVNRLVSRGVAQPRDSKDEPGRRYVALPPSDFVRQIREVAVARASELLPLLESLAGSHATDFIWPLTAPEQVAAKATELIGSASESILVSAWPAELARLDSSLKTAEARGVSIALVHFGPPEFEVGATYHHPVEQTLYEEKGGRGLTLVTDSSVVVIATFRPDGHVDGAWSRNESFVTVAEDYIKHDVYITKVTRFLSDAVVERFGPRYEKLRDVFNANA